MDVSDVLCNDSSGTFVRGHVRGGLESFDLSQHRSTVEFSHLMSFPHYKGTYRLPQVDRFPHRYRLTLSRRRRVNSSQIDNHSFTFNIKAMLSFLGTSFISDFFGMFLKFQTTGLFYLQQVSVRMVDSVYQQLSR